MAFLVADTNLKNGKEGGMKNLLLIFALAGTVSAQESYMFPIGSNVNSRVAKVGLAIGPLYTSRGVVGDEFDYSPTMGDLETVIENRLKTLAEKFRPLPGLEQEQYLIGGVVEPGPNFDALFKLRQSGDRWVIPAEVLEVKLEYGSGVGWDITGARDLRMRLFKSGQQIASFDTAKPYATYGFTLNPCFIPVLDSALQSNWAFVDSKYAVPALWDGTWDYGELDIVSVDGEVTVNLLNGLSIKYSQPPPAFLESFRVPTQAPVFTVNAPRISRIARVGNTTEITVFAEGSTSVFLEFSPDITGKWSAVPAYPVPLQLQTGQNIYTHTTDALTSFYRVRTESSQKQ